MCLRELGFTVMPEPAVSAELVHEAAALCHSTLEQRLAEVKTAGCDPIEQMYRFNSICHRQRNRWDLSIPPEVAEEWGALVDCAMDAATPIIREAQGSSFAGLDWQMSGAVISRPGARVQRFHVDAKHAHFEAAKADPATRIYGIFIPLVDIADHGDGTMFWPAPVLEESTRALARHMMGAPDSTLDPSALEAPATAAGGLIIYDYRTIHRGLPNEAVGGRERPVAYVVCASGGACDTHNFPQTAIGEMGSERARSLPYWNCGKVACDALDYYTEIEGDDAFSLPL